MTPFPLAVTLLTHDTQDYEQTLILFNNQTINLFHEVTKIVYFIGNEHMLIAHDSNRLRFS